jgi:small subunit ribosomal protein S6
LETVVKKLYEAMFLIDSAQAAADWDEAITTIKNILEKADAEIVSIRKWGERRLAYEINGKSRGTYILCYFRADGERVRGIERDIQLSERIMRVLILSTELMSKEDIEKQIRQDDGTEKDEPRPSEEKRDEQQIAQEPVKEAEESEESAEPVPADAGEVEQPEQPEQPEQVEAEESESAEADEK